MIPRLRFAHFLLWHGDASYRLAWFVAPQLLALTFVAWLLTHGIGAQAPSLEGGGAAWGVPVPRAEDFTADDALRDRAKSDPAAFDVVRAKAEGGDGIMQFELATLYDPTVKLSALVAPDMATALRWYRAAAEQGIVVAQNNYGNYIAQGTMGAPRDPASGLQWVLKAANADYVFAQRLAGIFYRDGIGAPANRGEALTWFQKAADKGDHYAQAEIASAYWDGVPPYDKDHAEAVKWYQKAAADPAETGAWRMLGFASLNGDGVPKNRGMALVWCRGAADRGETLSAAVVADAYWDGFPPYAKSRSEAVKWYLKAAANPEATGSMRMLGIAYRDGDGVAPDRAASLNWFYRAAQKGDAFSATEVGLAYFNGTPPYPLNPAEALKWLRIAANSETGIVAQRTLGLAYAEGRGTAPDAVQARYWLEKAAAAGDHEATRLLRSLR